MPKIVKTVDIDDTTKGGLSSLPKRNVLKGLSLGDPSYAYEQISDMLKQKRPQLVEMFDEFHRFTRQVEGGCHVKEGTFWKVDPLHGHEHLRNMIHKALVERLPSIPLKDIPFINITASDIYRWLVEYVQRTPAANEGQAMPAIFPDNYFNDKGEIDVDRVSAVKAEKIDVNTQLYKGSWLEVVHTYIKEQNENLDAALTRDDRNNVISDDDYLFVIERKDEAGPWLDSKIGNTLLSFAREMMAHVAIRHRNKSIIKQPTALSVERWINTEATRRRVDRIEHQFHGRFSNEESTINALKEAVHPALFVAFEKAFVFAKQKYSGMSVVDTQFITLLRDIHFVNLVCSFYNQSKLAASSLSSQRNKRDARVSTSQEIQQFLDAPRFSAPSRSIFVDAEEEASMVPIRMQSTESFSSTYTAPHSMRIASAMQRHPTKMLY
jgi:hypothetical protein